jgi:hypothetical protein
MGHPRLMCPGFLRVEGSLSHSDTPHSVVLRCTSDQPNGKELYLISNNTHKRQTFTTSVEFENAISASILPQTQALDGAATGIYSNEMQLLSYCTNLLNNLEGF